MRVDERINYNYGGDEAPELGDGEAMKGEIFEWLKRDKGFILYFVAVTALYLSPWIMLLVTSFEMDPLGIPAWNITFVSLYLGSLYLFFIAKGVVTQRKGVLSSFKPGIFILGFLTLVMIVLEFLAGYEILRPLALPAYLLTLLFSWNILYIALKLGSYSFFPQGLLSYFLIVSMLAFYVVLYRSVKDSPRTGKILIGVFLILSISALYYYLAPVKTLQLEEGNAETFALDVSANPVLDAVPTLEVLRLQGLGARWMDSWEHGPILVRGAPEQVSQLGYTWVKSISSYGYSIVPAPSLISSIPMSILGLLVKNYLWLVMLMAAVFYYARGVEVRGRELRSLVLYVLVLALLFIPLPTTVYFTSGVDAEEYSAFADSHRYFIPKFIRFQSHPQGGGGAIISRDGPFPAVGHESIMEEKYDRFITYYRIEKLQGFAPAIYALFMSRPGAFVYSYSYGLILLVLILYRYNSRWTKAP